MTEILDRLNAAKTAAMKTKIRSEGADREAADLELDVLRGVIGEIDRDSKEKKPRGVLAVLKSEHKKRVDSAELYAEKEQPARSAREAAEAEIVARFLPKEPTERELQYFIADFVGANGLQGTGGKSIGAVMAVLRDEFESFDGKIASALARKILA